MEQLQVNGAKMERLNDLEADLDQMAEDAQDLGQDAGARVLREAAAAVRKAIGRFDLPTDGDDAYTLRGA